MARETIREQAIAWAVRAGDPAFEEWDEFTQWLEGDPAHSRAYDQAILAVSDAAGSLSAVPRAQNDDQAASGSQRRRWIGGAVVMTLAVVAALGAWQMRGDSFTVETDPGEMRLVALDGGGQIALAGGSRIVLHADDPRVASLEQGQALFTIRHDPGSPFTLTVGKDTLVDVGTIFDVKRTPEQTTVAVSEGAVLFNPGAQNVKVSPGQRLSARTGSRAYRVGAIPLDQVGEWREGRLTFQDATLAEVASDLSRATGVSFAVTPRSADRRVSGSLVLDPVRTDPRTLGPLLGVTMRYTGGTWEIGAR